VTVIESLNKLKLAGLPEKQAEAILETFEDRDRSWFETQFEKLRGEFRAEVEKLRGEFRAEMEKLRTEIEKVRGELRGEIKDAKFQMIFWIVGSFGVATLINHFWR